MKKLIAIAFVTVVLGTSCKKDFLEDKYQATTPTSSNATKTADLKVDKNFDWKTTQETNLTLTGYANARVQVLNVNGDVIETARLETNKPYSTVINLPKTEKKIILSYMGQEIFVDLSQSNIQYTFN
ncbi:MAG: hypothetical protein Q8R57_05055 [Bacteroidota bacterium]|nr:hypothetical protein [Bacteroidota bacterium]